MDFFKLGGRNSTGWRQAAEVNSTILMATSLLFMMCLVTIVVKTGDFARVWFFYGGNCETAHVSEVNKALHLFLNLFSTAMEIDWAHASGSWFGIGVSSVRNAFRVSTFKTGCWIALLISSIPIHLLFNSTLFETDYRGSDFHLTIATEEFFNGAPFYPPGASLSPAGMYMKTFSDPRYDDRLLNEDDGYGFQQPMTDYDDDTSITVTNITATARGVESWEQLDPSACWQEYIQCDGLKQHRNIAMVIDQPNGWIRNDWWHLKDNETVFWDRYVPSDKPNHLFFDTQCAMVAKRTSASSVTCMNTCNIAMAGTKDTIMPRSWVYSFLGVDNDDPLFPNPLTWVNDSSSIPGETSLFTSLFDRYMIPNNMTSGLQSDFRLSVKYCLAQPLVRVCHVALSPRLLAAVTCCVLIKTLTAVQVTKVLGRSGQEPLVTLGDAVTSFIENPDPTTIGMSTIGQLEVRKGIKDTRLVPEPRQWLSQQKRRWAIVPTSVWVTTYTLFGVSISICATCFALAYRARGFRGVFLGPEANPFIERPFTLISGVLAANSPQLLVSFCYLAYNNLFTRLQMAREWALFGNGYHSLRVTDPKGEQYSTYRLQLPYKYSLPLAGVSVLLHWILSNCIYIFVSTGGYFGSSLFLQSTAYSDYSLPPSTAVAVGYSVFMLCVLMTVSILLICVPILLSYSRIPAEMVNIGSNSLALSAACHVSPLSYAVTGTAQGKEDGDVWEDSDDGYELKRLPTPELCNELLRSRTVASDEVWFAAIDGRPALGNVARRKIRWGVVQMPQEWYDQFDDDDERPVEHLSFGVEEDNVAPPIPGRWYA